METQRWEHAGLYDPASSDAAERRELLEYLTARGASVEEMVDAARLGGLAELAGRLLRRGHGRVSVEVLAARHGIPVDTVRRLLLAAGLPASPGTEVPAELDILVLAFVHGAALMGEEPVLAFARVLAASAINIAEAAVALFYAELGPGSERDLGSELGRAQMAERASLAFSAVPEAFSRLLEVQFERAIERAAAARGLGSVADPDAERVALSFVDLVGSTAWANRLDLREYSLALSRFEARAWSSAVLAGGRVVKMIGDEAFVAAPSVEAACRIAIEVTAAAAADPGLPSARGAIGVGEASSREGDYFGPVVNLVSRLVKVARPGAVLMTAEAAAELRGTSFEPHPVGAVALRGVAEPVQAFELVAAEGA
jgi:class 3 adenylate cyclase